MSNVEIWLYGSRARGDADALSDTDVLVVGEAGTDVASLVHDLEYPRLNTSFYSWEEIEGMRAYGSLYLHHIAMEGRQLQAASRTPDRFSALLTDVPRFARAREDMEGFRRALRESRTSLANGGWPDFECEVVATVARHAAILASYCLGEPAFGRETPFWIAGGAVGFSTTDLESLIGPSTAWRLHQPGPHALPRATENWLRLVARLLDQLEGVIDDYAGVLPQVA